MFETSIKSDQQAARARFDGALIIINSDPLTLQCDCLRAVSILAERVATIDPEAEPINPRDREYLNAYIPSWSVAAHWDLLIPEYSCSYDALLAQDKSFVVVRDEKCYLQLRLEIIVDLVHAGVTLLARLPKEDVEILWNLGKLDLEEATTSSRIYVNC